MLTLIFLSTLCIGWLFAVYYPLEDRRHAYEQKLADLQKQCHACSCASTICKQLESSIATARTSLKSYQYTDICPLVLCMELAGKAGLTVYACTMGSDKRNKELVTLEISGTTQAYMTFLNVLAQLPQIITYEQMHIEYAQLHQLRATCVLGFVTVQ